MTLSVLSPLSWLNEIFDDLGDVSKLASTFGKRYEKYSWNHDFNLEILRTNEPHAIMYNIFPKDIMTILIPYIHDLMEYNVICRLFCDTYSGALIEYNYDITLQSSDYPLIVYKFQFDNEIDYNYCTLGKYECNIDFDVSQYIQESILTYIPLKP